MDLGRSLKDALVAVALAAVLLVPIMGMVLDGTTLDFQLGRVGTILLVVFAGRFAVSLFVQSHGGRHVRAFLVPYGEGWMELWGQVTRNRLLVLSALLAGLIALPFLPVSSNYLMQVFTLSLIYVMLGIGLNIVVGLAGLLDLGYVAFYAVGAYSYALLAQYLDFTFWTTLPTAAALAALAGALLGFPVLRMHGDYLAIVTLGFGEIIRIVLTNMVWLTGGPNGISAPRPTLFGLQFGAQAEGGGRTFHEFFGLPYDPAYRYIFMYLILLAFVCASIWIFYRLREMPIGRAWEALREDEVACKALGINYLTTKLSAFTLGATFGGVGGTFFAASEGFINPASFTFIESAIILSIVVLGGMGSILGVVVAALGLTLLPEVFRQFEDLRMLFFGMAMVFVMIWRPSGLLRLQRKRFEEVGHAG